MEWIHLSIRAAHVLLGAFWAGAVLLAVFFLDPTVRESGPEGGRFMGRLVQRGYLTTVLRVGEITVVTGVYLLWRLSGGFSPGFMGSLSGILLSTGMLTGILALGLAHGVSRPTSKKLGMLTARIHERGAAPTDEELAEMRGYQDRLTRALRIVAVLMVVTVVTMAIGPHT